MSEVPAAIPTPHADSAIADAEEAAQQDLFPVLRATFENAAVGIAHVTPDGIWVRVNATMAEITGYSRSEMLSLSFVEITHPDDLDADLALTHKLLAGELEHFSMEKRYIRKDGQVKWVNMTVSLLRDAEGEPQYFISVVQDIDAQKSAEAERERLLATLAARDRRQQTLLEIGDLTQKLGSSDEIIRESCRITLEALGANRCGYLLVSPDRNRLTVQEDYTRGVPSVAGEYSLRNLPKAFRAAYERGETVAVSDTRTDPRTVSRYRAVFGPTHARSSLSVPLARGGTWIGVFGVHHDQVRQWTDDEALLLKEVGERLLDAIKRAEAERALERANLDLEKRVAERTADLQSAHKRMETFTYHVSHDLRSPLRTIISTSRILQEDFGDLLPEAAKSELIRQARAGTSLGNLIDDLLRLSRLGQEEITREQIDLTSLFEIAGEDVLARYPEATVTVAVDCGLSAIADPRLLRLAVENLVDNAVKYSPRGGRISVGQRDDGVYFVSDEGIGIESRYLEKIFEPFQRLHRDEEFAGTGIGLANVRQVINRHGGQVWAESEPGCGSTFLFTLPELRAI